MKTNRDKRVPQRANKRSSFQKAMDRAQFERWKVEKKTEREMAELLAQQRSYRLSHAQVHNDVKWIEQKWLREAMIDVGVVRASEIQALRRQESELWTAWQKSCLNAETTRLKGAPPATEGGKPVATEFTKTTEGQYGDTSIMRELMAVRERIAKMFALDPPIKHSMTDPTGTVPMDFVVKLSKDEVP